jgi:hypothetical protein
MRLDILSTLGFNERHPFRNHLITLKLRKLSSVKVLGNLPLPGIAVAH